MKKLLKIELVKILNYSSFKVILILHFLLFLLVIFVASQIEISFPGFTMKNLFQFPHVWESFAWMASWFNLLLAILLMVLVGNEFSYKTFRQQVITGLSRNDLILGKGIVVLIIAIYGVVLVLFTSILFGLIFTRELSISMVFEKSYILVVYFIQAIGYMTIGFFIAVLFRNTALSIIMYLLYFLLIEPIVRLLFPRDARLYFPVKIISNLTPRPEFLTVISDEPMVNASGQSNLDLNAIGIASDPLPMYLTILLALIYIAIFTILIFVFIRKRDI
jgi:ABC-2 type transport system permease protein